MKVVWTKWGVPPRVCPVCGKPCWGRRGCRKCGTKDKYGTLTRHYGYKRRWRELKGLKK